MPKFLIGYSFHTVADSEIPNEIQTALQLAACLCCIPRSSPISKGLSFCAAFTRMDGLDALLRSLVLERMANLPPQIVIMRVYALEK
ncbi:hypothetical protein AMTR_s00012p00257580 [Amborella trichopoda]|uniref:Uncharacterized protein n=1 Tax=Amborella trichopoda TaxID=13333 RepID=W1PLJ4_AMBTC|nr:hypothetical protein AMTR_s00012p00257580 [Amborella trichopoda]